MGYLPNESRKLSDDETLNNILESNLKHYVPMYDI